MADLQGKIAVVTGATRGCGRAIAVELGRLGATVYVTGRTTRESASPMGRPETIEETAELVDAAGGTGVPVRCDFTSVSEVDALRSGLDRVDVLVDDVWGGDDFIEWGKPYWESSLEKALAMVHNAVDTHLIALHRLLPLVAARPGGVVIEVTDGDNDDYVGPTIGYHVAKSAVRAIGRGLGVELAKSGCTGLTVTPGFLRSEKMLDIYGVTEKNWRDAVGGIAPPDFAISETPSYLGRGVAALATDPDVSRFAGRVLGSWTLMRTYGFADSDGTCPDWGRWMTEVREKGLDPATTDPAPYR
ncbi:SDR family NAD(P)-dependent oxidoreductase [Amycolatopsis acidicola]|uniref:SDR family NAD(P)-dependent oxidoreductase n=1 Tax=Amycolatopsis acidicola TaxID=2596893 RepID=A0A5N0URR1_9PSEU|nr:SDR family NAD(P)-dependent oxidoreductase [Amycolatopsis acidicola]KAA9151899.1 SDR family NAD(P)-dependent oxidoreductase [Amycolatopsis acidicola]